jgi:hypothetical protein
MISSDYSFVFNSSDKNENARRLATGIIQTQGGSAGLRAL